MKRFFPLSLLIALISVSAVADEKPKWMHHLVPIYDYLVVAPTPSNWQPKPAHSEGDGNFYLTEFLPEGQTVESWKEMITISGYKKIDSTPAQYFNLLYGLTVKTCGKEGTAAQVLADKNNVFVALLMCGGLQEGASDIANLGRNKGEVTLYRIYKMDESLYSIFHSWRGARFDVKDSNEKNLPASPNQIKEYVTASNSLLICSKEKPEGRCQEFVRMAAKN